ncbi:ABC transporter ATP-binding protein [Roseomonas sp. BN140053]|uniref:ABC transporter ATP-binding protein n=1 Tax=Roseomonas sp. BN140053 TaxID=3391898 RepID=UPI0039E9421B
MLSGTPLVEVEDLRIRFPSRSGTTEALRGVSFSMGREKLGIVGESGSGKSLTGRALLGLVPQPGIVSATALRFDGADLLRASTRALRQLRGRRIGLIMQDPKYSLNPVKTVGNQIAEAARLHGGADRAAARRQTLEMLAAVQIRDPERVWGAYPHEMSGGMAQRAMIAMMLVAGPDLLIADEPTSALDVTVQGEVLALMEGLIRQRGMGLILISHDLRLVSRFCDRIAVMYAGRVMETLDASGLEAARHPYTQGLLACLPAIDRPPGPLPVLRRDPAWMGA